jgi:hypothetical protein
MIVGALHKLVSSGRLPVDDRGDCQIVEQVDGNFQQAELSM